MAQWIRILDKYIFIHIIFKNFISKMTALTIILFLKVPNL